MTVWTTMVHFLPLHTGGNPFAQLKVERKPHSSESGFSRTPQRMWMGRGRGPLWFWLQARLTVGGPHPEPLSLLRKGCCGVREAEGSCLRVGLQALRAAGREWCLSLFCILKILFPINILTAQSLELEIISSHRSPLSPGVTLAGVDGSHFICKKWVTPTLCVVGKTKK